VALALLGTASHSHGEVYRCTDSSGRTTYGDAPCARGGAALKVPESRTAGFGDATVCAQLQDEMRRLDADARRAGKAAAKKDDSKRRQKLEAQYERRCASIHRSGH
jgi:hypothetical protein